MSLIRGMKNIAAKIEEQEAAFSSGDYVKADWFKLLDKQSASVQFLQDFDEDNPGYSEKNGLAVMAVEHSHPKLYRNKALCTFEDEGRCYGCEMNAQHPKTGWKQKTKIYVNVLADYGDGEPKVQILSSGLGKGQVAPVLFEIMKPDDDDEEPLVLTQTKFKITRSGAGLSDTAYLLTQKGKAKANPEDYELFDIEKVLRAVPYGEQQAFYTRGEVASEGEEKEMATAGSASDDEW